MRKILAVFLGLKKAYDLVRKAGAIEIADKRLSSTTETLIAMTLTGQVWTQGDGDKDLHKTDTGLPQRAGCSPDCCNLVGDDTLVETWEETEDLVVKDDPHITSASKEGTHIPGSEPTTVASL